MAGQCDVNPFEFVHRLIATMLAGALVNAVWWLLSGGHYPPFLMLVAGQLGLVWGIPRLIRWRNEREVRRLTDQYHLAAYEEEL